MTARGALLPLVFAVALLCGCRSHLVVPDPLAAPNRSMPAWGDAVGGLRVGVSAKTRGEASEPPAGGPITLNVTLQNVGAKPLQLVVPRSFHLSSDEPADATVAVRVATPGEGRPLYVVGPGPDGVRDVLLRPGEAVVLSGTIDRRAWSEPSDGRFARMRLTAQFSLIRSTTGASSRQAATGGNAATQPTLWVGTARSGPGMIRFD